MARTITHTTQAWLPSNKSPNILSHSKAVEELLFYSPPHLEIWQELGYTLVGPATITVEIADKSAIYAAKVESLKAAKKQVLAEAQAKATAIEGEIQKLLAISFEAREQEDRT